MRSRLHVVSGRRSDPCRFLEQAETSLTVELSADETLDAIGRTARLDAVLRARYAALLAPTPSEPTEADSETVRYLDAAQTASYLGISRSTVVRLTKAGTLPCIRPTDGSVRYDRQDLDSFMTARKGVRTSVLLPP
jgi:excisionase family DNA binding protein